MESVQFHIAINASKEKVWSILLGKDTYPEWVGISWPTSHYEGEWKIGNRVKFISSDGSGTLGQVIEHEQYRLTKLKHIAVLQPGGIEDRESDDAKGWIGTIECYSFFESGSTTKVVIEIETQPSWAKIFEAGWPAALAKLKDLAEQ